MLARLRVIDDQAAFEVLTPFVVDGGPAVLVDRGYVRPVQGSHAPPVPPAPGEQTKIVARLRDSEPRAEGKDPVREDGVTQVYSINTQQVGQLAGIAVTDPYLQLVADQPGGLGVVPLPHLDAGPFLSYGIQWIAFGIFAPIGLGYFIYAEIRERRRRTAIGGSASAGHRRAEARRPLRPPALSAPTVAATAATCTSRDNRTARRRSAIVGARPSPSAGRISRP